MDLNHLQYFRAVAECKSVSKAAEALFITQPALSKAISKLEAELGIPLFTRGKDGMTLNINGMRLLQCANAVFSELDRCMLDLKQNSMRRIKLISNNDYGLTAEFDHIQAIYPNLSISYTFDTPRACIDGVQKGSFQVALVEVRDGLYTDLERLYQIHWCVMAHQDHPIMQHESVTPEDIAQELVSVGNDRDKQFLLDLFQARKLQYRPFLDASNRESTTVENYINRCIAIGVVPYDIFYTLKLRCRLTPIRAIPLRLEESDPTYSLCLRCASGFPAVEIDTELLTRLKENIMAQWSDVMRFMGRALGATAAE